MNGTYGSMPARSKISQPKTIGSPSRTSLSAKTANPNPSPTWQTKGRTTALVSPILGVADGSRNTARPGLEVGKDLNASGFGGRDIAVPVPVPLGTPIGAPAPSPVVKG